MSDTPQDFIHAGGLNGARGLEHMGSGPPASLAHEAHSVKEIETLLQDKLVQHTSRDSDKFRQILRLFQQQVKGSQAEEEDVSNRTVGISEENFENVLALLDVWATRPQAKLLFDKYDMNGDGLLTAHEFVTRCRPVDFDTSVDTWNREPRRMPTGKRIYDHSSGTPSIPPTPGGSRFSVNKMARDLRQKFKQQYPSRMSMNSSRAKLNTYFQYFDRRRAGAVGHQEMRRVLDAVNFNIGDENIEELFKKFNTSGGFDYRAFSEYVFPQAVDGTLSTSLDIGQAFYERRSREGLSNSSANSTGTNWTYAGPSRNNSTFMRQPQSARHAASDAQLRAYAMQRPGMAMPNTARAPVRNNVLPTMDAQTKPFIMPTHRPATGSGMRPESRQGSIPIPPPSRSRPGTAHTARYASAGNLRPKTASQMRNSFTVQDFQRPSSQQGFFGGNDVSPIPGQQAEPAGQEWGRPERPQSSHPVRPPSRAPSRANGRPSRPASRAGLMQNPLQSKSSPYFHPQPINQFSPNVGIPHVSSGVVPKLRKVKKIKGKKKSQARLGPSGRPRPPPKSRPSHRSSYLERPSFTVF